MDVALPSSPAVRVHDPLSRTAVLWLTIFLGTLAALGPLAIDMYLPAFPRIADALGVQVPDVQRTLASYLIGLAIGQLIYGPLTDRFGRKPPLYVGLTLFALTSAGCTLVHGIWGLAAVRFVQALGGCAEMVVSRAIVRDLFDDKQAAKVFSSLMLVMGMAPILAPLLGGFLAVHFGWRAIFGLLAFAGVAAFFSTLLFFRESLPPERRLRQSPGEVLRTYGYLLTHRDFMLNTLTVAVGMAGLFAYVGGSPYVFEKIFHISESHFGLYFGPIACGIIGMSQVNGFLAGRYDIRTLLRAALCVQAVAGVVLLMDARSGFGGFWGIYVPLWFVVASMGFVFPNTTVLAMSPHARIAGNASALLGFLQFGVSAVGGFVVSSWQNAQTTPTPGPMAATIAACAVAALGINLLTRSTRVIDPTGEAERALIVAEH